MVYLATFYTHSGAIAFRRRAQGQGIGVRLMPVPRSVSSSCGTGASFEAETLPHALVDEETERVFAAGGGSYTLVYQNAIE